MDDLSRYSCEQKTAAANGGRPARAPLPGLFDALFEESDCGVLILERVKSADAWTVRDANPVIAHLLGCRREDLLGRSLSGLLVPRNLSQAEQALSATLSGDGHRSARLEFCAGMGRPRSLHTSLRQVVRRDAPDGATVVALFRQLKPDPVEPKAEAEAARERLLAQVSHELRTPLNGILGFAQLIEGGAGLSVDCGRYREYARDISSAGRELLGRIEDLLVAAEGEDGEGAAVGGESIAVAPLLESTVAEFRAEAERRCLTLTLLPSCESLRISGRRQDFLRIVSLLLESALRGAPSGSGVEMGCRRDEIGRVVIFCADRGHPIDPEEIVFNRSRAADGDGIACNPTPPPRSTAGLMALRALARRNGAELAFFAPNGGGHASSVIFPPQTAD